MMTHSEGFESLVPAKLRTVMLSGDWIGLVARALPGLPPGCIRGDGRRDQGFHLVNVYDVEEGQIGVRSHIIR